MKENSYLKWTLGALFFGAILFLNWTFSFSSDDCSYALMGTGSWAYNGVPPRLCTLANAWIENWNDGYRPVVHLFVRVFTGCFDKWVFNIANTCMMGVLFICILRIAKKRAIFDFNTMALLLALTFFVLCKGESYLWCAGSVNYLWAGTGSLLFCLIIERMKNRDESWYVTCLYCIIALFAGWLQEAFVLPIGCALMAYYLLNFATVSVKKVLVLLFYMVGLVLLVKVAGRRASTIPPFSMTILCMTMLKIALAIKAVWVLLLIFLISKDKKAFIVRNMFFLLVIGASIGMISIIGFNGERSLWAANLFSIVVIVREFRPSDRIAIILSATLLLTLGTCCWLGYRIKNEFDDFTNSFLASDNALCYHDRVDCGPFARFFHQCIYTWENGGHGQTYAYFYGRSCAPIALSKSDYEALLSDSFCIASNRIPIDTEAYTTRESNTIIVPLSESSVAPVSVHVEYDLPSGFLEKVKREIAMRKKPPVASPNVPREVCVNGRRFVFVSKEPNSDSYIRSIVFGY